MQGSTRDTQKGRMAEMQIEWTDASWNLIAEYSIIVADVFREIDPGQFKTPGFVEALQVAT